MAMSFRFLRSIGRIINTGSLNNRPQGLLAAQSLLYAPSASVLIMKRPPVSKYPRKRSSNRPKHPLVLQHIEHDAADIREILKGHKNDMPVSSMVNPYQKPPHKCILCRHQIEPDYKNVQLLSQFVSPYTGQILNRSITGLCIPMQRKVARSIITAQRFRLMPILYKDLRYVNDPKLFNPFRPSNPVGK